MNEDGLAEAVPERPLATEEQLESAVESAPELLGLDLLIIGRQVQTPSGPLDLLAIDSDARLVVIENKRGRTPREVLAQVIDYAAWAATLGFDAVENTYAKYRRASFGNTEAVLAEDFEEQFDQGLDSIGEVPRMVVVATHLDDSTERMIAWLNDSFDVPVNAILFQPFKGGLLGRTWLRPDASGGRSSGKRSPNAAVGERNRQFWAAMLPVLVRKKTLRGLGFAVRDVTSSYVRRDLVPKAPGIPKVPAALRFWAMTNSARVEIVFDGGDRQLNVALWTALQERRTEIEGAYGCELDWDAALTFGQNQRSRSLRAAEVEIADMTDPPEDSLVELAGSACRLVDAVMPHLGKAFEEASSSLDDPDGLDESDDPEDLDESGDSDGPDEDR